jgi:NAD(P)-dependent dehydrogenase (short-subunit alcohol dehydrogenase family)
MLDSPFPARSAERDLAGRVAVVVGGAGGIGSRVSVELAARGASVVVSDLRPPPGSGTDPIAAVTAEIEAAGGTAVGISGPALTEDAAAEVVGSAVRRFGRVDILVNAAGVHRPTGLLDSDEADWTEMLDVHLAGHLACAHAVLPMMRAAGYGRLINFTSGVGLIRDSSSSIAYAIAKRGVAALTWAMAATMTARGVTINAVSPLALTAMSAGAGPGLRDTFPTLSEPGLIAPLVAFLASPRAGFVHGRVLFVNGPEISLIRPGYLVESISGIADAGPERGRDALARLIESAATAGRSGGGGSPRLAHREGVA